MREPVFLFRDMRKKSFYIDLFGVSVTVIISDDVSKDYRDMFGFDDSCGACTWERLEKNGSKSFFVMIELNPDPSTIVHESVHLCNSIMKHIGIPYDYKNDETQAYLTGYLFEKISETLAKEIKRISKNENRDNHTA